MEITTQARPRRRLFRLALGAVLAVAALGLIAPFVNATSFSGRIHGALEESLGRKVDFEKVYFRLFPVPGFSLENITIHEDPRFGLEPFAYAGSLQARLRIDKLLLGQIRFASLRLVEPSLNLVKRGDGTWNVVELVERLSAPRRVPLSLFPAIEVANGRIDFKFGTRKTTLYITESDLSIYPARSGKVVLQFSGSPARTDRAGNGFGHVSGTVNWYLDPARAGGNQLSADVVLERSNLSELTTLIEGHDIGVHGTISSHAQVAGPARALRVVGQLRLEDVHRWDLMAASGDDWRIGYDGTVDLAAHSLDLRTLPARSDESVPVALRVRVTDFLTRPSWSVFATMHKAPVEALLPLGRRMGIALPAGLEMEGGLDGVVGYSNVSGLAGGVAISAAVAKLPNIPPLRSAAASIQISADNIHIAPAILQAAGGGTLRVGGDYHLANQRLDATVAADEVPVETLTSTIRAWFGAPAALAAVTDGYVSGQFSYSYEDSYESSAVPRRGPLAGWRGDFQFSNAVLNPPGLAIPLKHAQGHAQFDPANFDLPRFSATLGQQPVLGSYHYNLAARRPERLHIEMPVTDLAQIADALEPALQEKGLLSRLLFTRRAIPAWLATRNLEGDVTIGRFSANQIPLGPLAAHFVWQGTNLQFTGIQLRLPSGLAKAAGTVNLAAYSPKARFSATLDGIAWGGGLLQASGQVETSGLGMDAVRNLRASGAFAASDVSLSPGEDFDKVSGLFDFSFDNDSPSLRLTKVKATQDEDEWLGAGASRGDGRLTLDLENGGRQIHLARALLAEAPGSTAAPVPSEVTSH